MRGKSQGEYSKVATRIINKISLGFAYGLVKTSEGIVMIEVEVVG